MDKLIVGKLSKCHFCGSKINDKLKYGPKYKLGNIVAHYFCVLLSNRLIQNGSDNEGMLGFLLSDIQKELQRSSGVLCSYCKRGGANISCAHIKCRRSFHLPCGLKVGSSHQFMNQFKSFCHKHRLIQQIPKDILLEAMNSNTICCICQELVSFKETPSNKGRKNGKMKIMKEKLVLWAPCCLKNWYHKSCVQKLANSAGYFFRCAACNDSKKFNDWMQKYGIFIPQQDASWELAPNAFEELLFRYDKCDAFDCRCPNGRQENTENTLWEIILCESCGSQGIHVACGNLNFCDPKWECLGCRKVIQKMLNKTSAKETIDCNKAEEDSPDVPKLDVFQKKRQRSSEDLSNSVLDKRKKCRTNVEEEEEIEIDVETVEGENKNDETLTDKVGNSSVELPLNDNLKPKEISGDNHQNLLTLLKPGPLSYKLGVINKIWEKSVQKTAEGSGSRGEFFDLSNANEKENARVWKDYDLNLLYETFRAEIPVANNVLEPEKVRSCNEEEMPTSNTDNLTASNEDLVIIKEVITLID